jgi:hypothetical protein
MRAALRDARFFLALSSRLVPPLWSAVVNCRVPRDAG